MVSCNKLLLLIIALVTISGAASVEPSPDGVDDDNDSSVEVLPEEHPTPSLAVAVPAVEVTAEKASENAANGEPPGNPTWWQKAKGWFKKHATAAKEWFAKLTGSKERETRSTKPADGAAAAAVEKVEEPAGNPGWWDKTKGWVSGLFGSKKD